ncbi:MAG: hypothetical protein IJX98_02430 [Clostridia bacterium]|nr:hypothetical protein [Clostridia bacterium]
MNGKKMWHALGVIALYLCTAALTACLGAWIFSALRAPWGVPLGIGVAVWALSIVFFALREKSKAFQFCAVPLNALASGVLISAFIVGKALTVEPVSLLLLACFCALCYLFLMALLTVPRLSEKIWYQIVAFAVWMTGSVFLCIWLYPLLLGSLNLALPERETFLLFFLLLLGFLAFGSLLEAENFPALLLNLTAPAMIATCLIGLIVIAVLSGCDSFDCGDCGGCDGGSGGTHNAKRYGGQSKIKTMSDLANGDR